MPCSPQHGNLCVEGLMTSNQTLKSARPVCSGARSSYLVKRTRTISSTQCGCHNHHAKLKFKKARLCSFSAPPRHAHTLPAVSVNPYPQAYWPGRIREGSPEMRGTEAGKLDQQHPIHTHWVSSRPPSLPACSCPAVPVARLEP